MAMEGAVGLILIGAALLLVIRRERLGIRLASFGLLVALTITNLLVFYFEQFSTIIAASIQFVLMLGVLRYRRRHIGAEKRAKDLEMAK